MNTIQTLHCILSGASDKMPERYEIELTLCKWCWYFSIIFNDDFREKYRFFKKENGELLEENAILLPGILRDIAERIGWEYQVTIFEVAPVDCKWYKSDIYAFTAWKRGGTSGRIDPDIHIDYIPNETPLEATVSGVWVVMRKVYGAGYCNKIEQEVTKCTT